jgi:hypothetical protein
VLRVSALEVQRGLGSNARWLQYTMQEQRATLIAGGLASTSIDMPQHLLSHWCKKLLRAADNIPEFKNMFLLHEVKGVKDAYYHEANDRDAAQVARDDLFSLIDLDQVDTKCCYLDVAIEISAPDYSLFWITSKHKKILKFIMTAALGDEMGPKRARELLNSSNFVIDYVAGLSQISGHRCNTMGSCSPVIYSNIYSTDKQVTHQHHRGQFRDLSPSNFFPQHVQSTISTMTNVLTAYHSAASNRTEGAARFEVRVQLRHLDEDWRLFPTLEKEIIEECVIPLPSDYIWWVLAIDFNSLTRLARKFRYWRQFAIRYCTDRIARCPNDRLVNKSTLVLIAVLAIMHNALKRREPTRGVHSRLLDTVGCHRQTQEPIGPALIRHQFGFSLLAGIYYGPEQEGKPVPPRIAINIAELVDDKCICKLFAVTSIDHLGSLFDINHGILPRGTNLIPGARTSNRKRVPYWYLDHYTRPFLPLNLESINWTVLFHLKGPGVNQQSLASHPEKSVAEKVSLVVQAFGPEALSLSPNPKDGSKRSYATVSREEMLKSNSRELFNTLDLTRIFATIKYKETDDITNWNLAFDCIFPEKDAVPLSNKAQNYSNLAYRRAWCEIMQNLSTVDAARVRTAVRNEFNKWRWIPRAQRDCLWDTGKLTNSIVVQGNLHASIEVPAPHILLNPKYRDPTQRVRCALRADESALSLPGYMALREEEEEESSDEE